MIAVFLQIITFGHLVTSTSRQSPGEQMSTHEQKKQSVALSSVAASMLLTIMKIVAGLMTGSIGIISEAAHSAMDSAQQLSPGLPSESATNLLTRSTTTATPRLKASALSSKQDCCS